MKLTAIQIESALLNSCSAQGVQNLRLAAEELNAIIELETCHELALCQNVAVENDYDYQCDTLTGSYIQSKYAIYKSLYMKPAPPLTRAELLQQMLNNEINGRELYQGLEFNYFEDQWSSIAEHHDVDFQHPENYRIIK